MEEIDLKEVFDYFKEKKLKILITLIIVLIIGNLYIIFFKTPMYESNTTIVLVNENQAGMSQSDLQLNKNLVSTYSEIVKSRKVLSRVIEDMELDITEKELAESITVTAVADTEIIKISVINENNELARNITDKLANVFMDEINKIYNLKNIAVLDRANLSEDAYNNNLIKDNIVFILIGLVISSGMIFITYYFDTTIKSSDEIENKLGLTILGIVPDEEGRN